MLKKSWFKRICWTLICVIAAQTIVPDVFQKQWAYAQNIPDNVPQVLLAPSHPFQSPVLKAIRLNPEHPFEVDFMIDGGDVRDPQLAESQHLIEYFLAGVATPEDKLWVNLSPLEPNRIMPFPLDQTRLGQEMLNQDYLLKRMTASFTYPETPLGQTFWQAVREKLFREYGLENLPDELINKVWIIPDRAVVYEKDSAAFIAESHLSVMLAHDYIQQRKEQGLADSPFGAADAHAGLQAEPSLQIIRELILPEIEKEVNTGATFAPLRQMFYSIILATWFKKKVKQHIINQLYADKSKIEGVSVVDPLFKNKVYERYLKLFKEGVYNYIREDIDPETQEIIPRKYFAGGVNWSDSTAWLDVRAISRMKESVEDYFSRDRKNLRWMRIHLDSVVTQTHKFIQSMNPKNTKLRLAALLLGFFLCFQLMSGQAQAAENVKAEIQAYSAQIRDFVTLKDVLALDGLQNSVTKQKYSVDKKFWTEANLKKALQFEKMGWQESAVLIAVQHKLGVPEDAVWGQISIRALQQQMGNATASVSGSGTPPPDDRQEAVQPNSSLAADLSSQVFSDNQQQVRGYYYGQIAGMVTIDDVRGLLGTENPETHKPYNFDADYIAANWKRIAASKEYGWAEKTLVIAAQKKFGLKQDAEIGRATQAAVRENVMDTSKRKSDSVAIKVNDAVPPQALVYFDMAKRLLSINDVLALRKIKDRKGQNIYAVDEAYIRRHWHHRLFRAEYFSWPQEVLMLAFQLKQGLPLTGALDGLTRKELVKEISRGNVAASSESTKTDAARGVTSVVPEQNVPEGKSKRSLKNMDPTHGKSQNADAGVGSASGDNAPHGSSLSLLDLWKQFRIYIFAHASKLTM